jgi:hypothetical protein
MTNIQAAQLNLILNEEAKKDLQSLWHQQLLCRADPNAAATSACTTTHSTKHDSQDQSNQQQPDLWTDPTDKARTPDAANKMATSQASPEPSSSGYSSKPGSVSQPPPTAPSAKTPEDTKPKTAQPIRILLMKRNPPRKLKKLQETDPLPQVEHAHKRWKCQHQVGAFI